MFSMNGGETVEPGDQRSKAIILLSQLLLAMTDRYPRPDHVGDVVDAIAEYVHTIKPMVVVNPGPASIVPEEPAKVYAGKAAK